MCMHYTIKGILIFCSTVVWKRENDVFPFYKVFHVMVGLTVYWYTLHSENYCQYTCRSLSFIFYVKKIYISIYLYFFYCKSNLWKIKIFKETLSFTCLRYIHAWSRILDLHENISLTASVNQICSTNVQYCIKGSRW